MSHLTPASLETLKAGYFDDAVSQTDLDQQLPWSEVNLQRINSRRLRQLLERIVREEGKLHAALLEEAQELA